MSRPLADESAFRAVAHPVRRRLLDILRDRERTAGELAQPFHMSKQAFSQHLRILRTAGLVRQRRSGRRRIYALEASRLRPVSEWIGGYQRALT